MDDERIKINNELVTKSYRNFCNENNLNFHYWKELPENQFDPKIAKKEMKLHQDVMLCFNELKPHFVYFDNKIYSFNYTDWGGGFEYKSWEIQDFLDEAYNNEIKSEFLRKWLTYFSVIILVIFSIFLWVELGFLLDYYNLPDFSGIILLPFTIALALLAYFEKKIVDKPLNKIEKGKENWRKHLLEIKKQLN